MLNARDAQTDVARLAERVRELEARLHRERSRSAGLERGLTALDESASELRRENAGLRRALGERRRFSRDR